MFMKVPIKRKEDFPFRLIDKIESRIEDLTPENINEILKEGVIVELNFMNDAIDSMDKETLDLLQSRLNYVLKYQNLELKHFLEFDINSLQQLSPKIVKSVLQNPDVVELLSDDCLKKLLTFSEEVAEFAIQQKHIGERLNQINTNPNQQTFPSSCAARAILLMMYHTDHINEKECTPLKEFEIYKSIWTTPGGVADPAKLMSFLENNKLNVISIVLEDRAAQTLKNAEGKDPGLVAAYGMFKNRSKNLQSIPNSEKYVFPNNSTALVMVSSKDMPGGHLVFCRSNDDGEITVVDPSSGEANTHKNFHDFMKNNDDLGVHFQFS
ncbi:hypothetical protein [Legionella jamestowniensis]|uniref:Dehydrogenase n=1 Tax=Legionella jamestowniensis TaxID=455 RepID=A0A0W0UFV7_9GAMM|nr:hypothetical protein [Legionella jamestowniensis]KTD06772.1 dehydrogenase [Legionella jamestowniensis]OCH97228.1 hypothetical protein A8135_03795 [Legionella jamestowniensis]SFL83494.1 hypothetical protein SAMN02746073_2145 [Legionella jamestowniensis DSM 19215]